MAEPWYAAGLRFACTRCGRCCSGAPGHVWLSEAEADAIAERLGLERGRFREVYTRLVWRGGEPRRSLRERGDGACVFWSRAHGCLIYELRPRQCRTWPFWASNLVSPEAWQETARDCPGIGRGPLHDAATIAALAADDGLPPR
ncbi:MAG: YkgJ family cysteine cluster protein [Planctomycetota bacterium]|nr:YkgJ family cysteine cluster protein [Planctomycetota bacterium]MCX8039404.1 YkgJ family cysteine cluster protein [Planctomycetota bacterium]MDW8373320.1 YkgJ family cysteine cluster protein [Planctomycetota bacterium]